MSFADNQMMVAILQAAAPKTENDDLILHVNNRLQQDKIYEEGSNIQKAFERLYNNRYPNIQVIVVEIEEEKNKVFRSDDKFRRLIEINPSVLKLKDALKLEIVF
jgi:hypothetical protein